MPLTLRDMNKFIFTLCISLLLMGNVKGQTTNLAQPDSIYTERVFLQTNAYRNQIKLSKSKFANLLKDSQKWSRKNRMSNIMIPLGPVVMAGGVYLGYDAIKGIPAVAVVNEKEYPYTIRSLPKLVGGLGAFAVGTCLLEYGNGIKTNAASWYNANHSKKSVYYTPFIDRNGLVGIRMNF